MAEIYQFPLRPAMYAGNGTFPDPPASKCVPKALAPDADSADVNQRLVQALEKALEMARAGQLQSLVAAGWTADGARLSLWAEQHPNVFAMYGSLTMLAAEYLRRHPEIDLA